MTRGDVHDALLKAIREALEQNGEQAPTVSDETRPLQDLDGFDSLVCVEVEVMLTERLQHTVEGIFMLDDGKKAKSLRVRQLVNDLCRLLEIKEGAEDARP
jgi:acyl carrier protein